MSESKNPGVDPRFDPAFQRGFDPTTPIEKYVPPRVQRKTAVVASTPVVAPAPNPAPASPPSPGTSRSSEPEVILDPVPAEVEATDETHTDSVADTNPSRNPFLLFLGIIAVALVAVGIWLFVRSGEAFNSAEVRSQGDYMSLDATIHMAPFISLLGGATAIGILFVFAVRYRKRR